MREAGVRVLTVGVFGWSRIEPRPGERDLGWLDRVLDLLHSHDLRAFLATPTASPPPWLGHLRPETLPVDAAGRRLGYGSRNQFCPSAPAYRAAALALVEDLAARYAGHPALAAWHVGNELGPTCFCDETAAHFRWWLRARYGELDVLNEAWGTAVWSQRYGAWDEVLPPRRAPYLLNPAQQLDFRRFTSDALLEHYLAERAVLRRLAPGVPVTTNCISLSPQVDQWRWAAEQDLVSIDLYGDPEDPLAPVRDALACDAARSLGGGRPWALMEQAASAVSWRRRNLAKRPGQMRLWSLQAVARGADAVCFFQWRASRQGPEKFHSAMLPHAGPETRVHREVRALGAELARLGEVAGGRVPARVAVLLDWESWWAFDLEAHPRGDLDLLDLLAAWYRPLWQAGVAVDVAHPARDLGGYDLVLAPNLYLVTDAAAANLAGYVAAGGHLVAGFFSGVVDEHDRIRPAPFRKLLGIVVEEFRPLGDDERVTCASAELGRFTGHLWTEDLRAEGAKAVAAIEAGDLAGTPAITRHAHGRGLAWYVATRPEDAALAALLRRACAAAGVRPAVAGLPAGVEAVRRGDVLFLLNHGEGEAVVALDGPHRDLLGGSVHDGSVALERFGAAALRIGG
jgi:beta-galactosidase